MEETLKAWAAGTMDGEGSITIKKSGVNESSLQILVALTNTDGRMIDIVYEHWGGFIHAKTAEYMASSSGRRAARTGYWLYFSDYNETKRLLVDILPYLKTKQEHALIVLAALLAIGKPDEGKRRCSGVTAALRPFYEKIKVLDQEIHTASSPIAKTLQGTPQKKHSHVVPL